MEAAESQSAHSLSLLYHLAQLKLTHYPGILQQEHLLTCETFELHEPLFTALTFPSSIRRRLWLFTTAALCPDGDA